jgi:hypothetical protein
MVTSPIPSTSFAGNSTHPNYARTPSTSTRKRGDDENNDSDQPLPSAYPPMNEDEVDTSRVTEVSTVLSKRPPHRHIIDFIFQNLRQWDVAERHRRKAVREFAAKSPSSSMMGDITRLFWPKRMQGKDFRTHVALQSQENIGSDSLTSFDTTPNPSPASSPPRRLSEESDPDNPFSNPPGSLRTVSGSQDQLKLPGRSSTPGASPLGFPSLPKSSHPGTSRSLRLPSALMSFSNTNTHPTTSATPTLHLTPIDDDQREGRWWHDWLCGCGGGTDRGGDCQVRSHAVALLELIGYMVVRRVALILLNEVVNFTDRCTLACTFVASVLSFLLSFFTYYYYGFLAIQTCQCPTSLSGRKVHCSRCMRLPLVPPDRFSKLCRWRALTRYRFCMGNLSLFESQATASTHNSPTF